MMRSRFAMLLAALAVAGTAIGLPARATFMSVDAIKPGMKGVGTTVFDGARRESFGVHILGVLRNTLGPRRNLILARLEGGRLAETGVIQGMSGSPVYIDGQLVGAVSYSLGAFAKEPIAGITPIQEMTETVALPARPPLAGAVELPVTEAGLFRLLRRAAGRIQPFASRPADVDPIGLPGQTGRELATMLRPIATPLVMSGFLPDVADTVSAAFRDQGFVPTPGRPATEEPAEPLQPGDAVGVSLIRGDLELGATGTVTHVDGNRVYAFGHPFYNLGPIALPMTRAHVFGLLPSLLSSVKISSVGQVIGVFQQDRATAIAGTLGPGPSLIPLALTLETERGLSKSFSFDIINDQLFTPLLTFVAIVNTLRSYEREFGAATFTVRGVATVKGHGEVAFEDIFTGETPSAGAATYVAGPITFLLGNKLAPVEIEGVRLTIRSAEKPLTATLERVWLDQPRPKPGETVTVRMLTRSYRGDETIRSVTIPIPLYATGPLSVLVADGVQLAELEQREMRRTFEPENVAQMIRVLNRAPKRNRLYVRLLANTPGAAVAGEALSSLPASVLAVLEGHRNGGDFTPLRTSTLGEWELNTEQAVVGSRVLTIDIGS